MVNQYPAHCVTCGTKQAAGHGKAVRKDGRWVCDCSLSLSVRAEASDEAYDAWKDRHMVNGTWGRRGQRPRW